MAAGTDTAEEDTTAGGSASLGFGPATRPAGAKNDENEDADGLLDDTDSRFIVLAGNPRSTRILDFVLICCDVNASFLSIVCVLLFLFKIKKKEIKKNGYDIKYLFENNLKQHN